MDTTIPASPVAESQAPVAPTAPQQPTTTQPLGQEGVQAPPSTGGSEQVAGPDTTGQTPGTFDPSQYISREEYEALQTKAAEDRSLIQRLEELANQQQEAARQTQFRNSVNDQIRNWYREASDLPDEDRAVQLISQQVFGLLDQVTQNFQQTVDQYHTDTEQVLWGYQAPGVAERLIQEHGLDPIIREELMQMPDEDSMTRHALLAKNYQQHLVARYGQARAQQAAEEIRQSGVTQMGGDGAGSNGAMPEEISRRDAAKYMREAFGLR